MSASACTRSIPGSRVLRFLRAWQQKFRYATRWPGWVDSGHYSYRCSSTAACLKLNYCVKAVLETQ